MDRHATGRRLLIESEAPLWGECWVVREKGSSAWWPHQDFFTKSLKLLLVDHIRVHPTKSLPWIFLGLRFKDGLGPGWMHWPGWNQRTVLYSCGLSPPYDMTGNASSELNARLWWCQIRRGDEQDEDSKTTKNCSLCRLTLTHVGSIN